MVLNIQRDAEPIAGYKLVEPLGRGGFGEVWKAQAPGGLMKAIKFVFGSVEDEGGSRRADQELRSLARVRAIRHPFLLSIERYDIIEGQLVIVMELADGDLMDRFRACRQQGLPGIPEPELLRYMEETAEVLDVMNLDHDLQHLDVKPQNLCLVHNHVKVADFGLVKDLTGLMASVTGGLTPKYAPPETFHGMVSRSSDQYSLALVYQELLTGSGPYTFTNLQEVMQQHTSGLPDLESLPAGHRPVVARALAKDPEQRYPSCRAFIAALRGVEAPTALHPSPAGPPTFLQPSLAEPGAASVSGRQGATRAQPGDIAPPPGEEVDAALLERTEESGEGILVPALLIGLGGFGLEALRQFRRTVRAQLGEPGQLPHLRLFGIDTDAKAVELAQQGTAAVALDRDEAVVARLGRASHYLRPRDPLPSVEAWLPPRMLNRISRTQGTAGFRALGRLAFIDNYPHLVTYLRKRLEQIGDREALPAASRRTGLPVRSNRPRVYVLSSLAGGTGSGMIVDVAYVVRGLLREFGHPRADVVGLFLLPPHEAQPELLIPRANGYAALAELSHFADTVATFQAQVDSRAPALTDSGPPFTRTLLVRPAAQPGGANPASAVAEQLYLELFTPLGQEIDPVRKGALVQVTGSKPAPFQAFGATLLLSPSRPLLREAGRRLAQALLDQWTQACSPQDAAQLRQEIGARLQGEKLDAANLIELIQKGCAGKLGSRLEQVIGRWFDPVAGPAARFDHRHVPRILRQADEFFGHPDGEDGLQQPPGKTVLREVADELGDQVRQALSRVEVSYLQQPGPRLGLTVEALKQAGAQVDRWLQVQDEVLSEGETRLKQLRERLETGHDALERSIQTGTPLPDQRRLREELSRQLTEYPAGRQQVLLAAAVRGIYLALRGFLSDQVRELAFYRHPLEFLHQALTEEAKEAAGLHGQPAARLLPAGCTTLEQAAEKAVKALTRKDLLALDKAVQEAVSEQSDGREAVWTVAGNDRGVKILWEILLQQAEKLLHQRLPVHDVAELFLERATEDADVAERLRQAFAAAAPVPTEALPLEIAAVMAPESAAGTRLLAAARSSLSASAAVAAGPAEELVVYREAVGLGLWDLERLGLVDQLAYARVCAREPHAAHTRSDIPHWGKSLATR